MKKAILAFIVGFFIAWIVPIGTKSYYSGYIHGFTDGAKSSSGGYIFIPCHQIPLHGWVVKNATVEFGDCNVIEK